MSTYHLHSLYKLLHVLDEVRLPYASRWSPIRSPPKSLLPAQMHESSRAARTAARHFSTFKL